MAAANILMWISIALFISVSVYSIISILRKGKGYKASRTALIFALGLVCAVFVVRLGFTIEFSKEKFSVEALSKAILNTLQSFSMDGSYDEWLSEITSGVFAADTWYYTLYRIYTAAIYVIAPMTGGAILFEILADIFPHIKLLTASILRFREILYFSELNKNSLALANNVTANKFLKPLVVFTNTQNLSDGAELKPTAKAAGALCFDDDIIHIHLRHGKNKKLFLIAENEADNLCDLGALISKHKRLRKAKIFLFSSDDMGIQAEQQARREFQAANKSKPQNSPDIYIINSKRNLARNLLSQLPLYEPLAGRVDSEKGYDLRVTIAGAGYLGTELFLSSYWYGQLLGCRLKITVISKENEQDFTDKINSLNPEILRTADKSDSILKIYPLKDELSEPYFEFKYCSDDIMTCREGSEAFDSLVSSDYIMVAIGTDENNIAAAERIKREIGKTAIDLPDKHNRTIIACLVFDPDLNKTFDKMWNEENLSKYGIYMHAFGSRDELYGADNVYMEAYTEAARNIQDKYDFITYKKISAESRGKRTEYEYWANISRAMHLKYKVFSAGCINTSVFNGDDIEDEERIQRLNDALEEYKKAISDNRDLRNKLAWLENRRWNAFMRINGFRCPKDFNAYTNITGDYKNFVLKLHPCITECDKNGMKPDIFADNTDKADFDCLDFTSLDIDKYNSKKTDYKKYDNPTQDSLD